jgi:hypothetical protein
MERCSTFVLLAVLLTLACLSPAAAVVPKPDGYTTVNLAQGWFDNQLVWYIGTNTNNIRFAQIGGLTLAPKLFSAIADGAAQPIYIVLNYQQGPVFSGSPSDISTSYSGLWRVHYLTWTTGTKRPITNSDPATGLNPYGIPASGITDVTTDIVVDYPILIVGQLGLAAPTFKIPQLVSFNAKLKTAVLPYFKAFCQNYITKKVSIVNALITESSDADVAALIGANYSLLLETGVDIPDTQDAWLFYPFGTSPPSQLPILEYCPTALSWRNSNFGYSPVMRGHLLLRTGASPASIINNPTTVGMLIGNFKLTEVGFTALNVHLLTVCAN